MNDIQNGEEEVKLYLQDILENHQEYREKFLELISEFIKTYAKSIHKNRIVFPYISDK